MFYIKAKNLIPIGNNKFLTEYRGLYIVVKDIHPLTKDGKLNKWFLVDNLGVNGYYFADMIYYVLPKKYILNFQINAWQNDKYML